MQIRHRLEEHYLYSSPLITQQNSDLHKLESFSTSAPNNACILASGYCCQLISKSPTTVTCMVFKNAEPVYDLPIDSRVVGIYKVQLSCGFIKRLSVTMLASKAICYTGFKENCLVFIKLLHAV